MEFTPTFKKLKDAWMKRPRYIDSAGGTRSGKTYAALQLLFLLAVSDKKPTITSVVSETFPHLKRGAIRDFKTLLGQSFNEDWWSASDSIYRLPNGAMVEFFSADQPSKVHGPARDRLFINEAVNIDYDTARQLFVRTREFIMLDYNPTHAFWVHTDIQPRENCASIHSTYKDNPYLTAEQIAEIEGQKHDANWWRVYGEGLVGQLEGLIFEFEQVDAMPERGGMIETYGIDFGFTNDPTAICHTFIDTRKRELWFDEVCYQRGMLNADIVAALKGAGVRGSVPVICDAAEPKTIAEIHNNGYNALPCYKATRVAEQLQAMRGYKIHVTKQSINAVRELRGYVWMKDKDGRLLNEPTPYNNHFIDAARYSCFQYIGAGQQTTRYSRC